MINCDYNFVMRNSFPPLNIIGNSSWIYLEFSIGIIKKKQQRKLEFFLQVSIFHISHKFNKALYQHTRALSHK